MKLKKNPKVDLRGSSGLYFVIGLTLVLFLVWRGLEWKTYDEVNSFDYSLNVEDDLDEEVPMTEQIKTPPVPPPLAAPEIIEVVEDEEEIEETVIESTESSQEEEVMDVEDVVVEEEEIDEDVPFSVIEDVPIFPGCEKEKAKGPDAMRACFSRNMQKHVRKYFRYPEIAQEMGIQGKVNVFFTIQKDGSIGNIRMKGPDKNLEKEAQRIIGKLPKMIPGKQRGKAVRVPFFIPITFKLQQ